MALDSIELHDNLRTIEEKGADPVWQASLAFLAAMKKHRVALLKMHENPDAKGSEFDVLETAEPDALHVLVFETPCGSHAAYVLKIEYLSIYSSDLDWGEAVESACTNATFAYREEREAA